MLFWTLIPGLTFWGCATERTFSREYDTMKPTPKNPESMHKKNPRIREELEVIIKEASRTPYLNQVDPILKDARQSDAKIVEALSRRMKDIWVRGVFTKSFDGECDNSLNDGELKINWVDDVIDNIPHIRVNLWAKLRVPGSRNYIIHHSREILSLHYDSAMDIDWARWLSKKPSMTNSIIYTGFDWISLRFAILYVSGGFRTETEDVNGNIQGNAISKVKTVSNACLIIPQVHARDPSGPA